ncbi:ABC transporter substrate-binding protein [Patescibacteria group bacterium]
MKRFFTLSRITRIFKKKSHSLKLEGRGNVEKKIVFSLAKSRLPSFSQLSYLPKYLEHKERSVIRALVLLVVVALVFVGVRYYQRHIEILPDTGGEYVEALIGQPKFINPVLAQDSDTDNDLARLMYSGLLRFNDQMEIVPDLAERFEISEDQKSYTLKLLPDLLWSDEQPITANDVLFTVETIQDPDVSSPLASSLRGVTVELVDDLTIRFTLDEPFAPFLSTLTFGILPVHIWGDVLPSNLGLAEFNIRPVGNGPYQFSSLQKNRAGDIKSYTVSANPHYHDKQPYISKITFKLFPDFQTAIDAAKNRNVDSISFVPRSYESELAGNDDLVLNAFQLPQYTAIFFYQKNDLLKDHALKEALALGIDKEKLLTEVLGGDGVVAHGPIPQGFLGYHKDIKKFDYDVAAAKKLLDDAGWAFLEGETVRKKGDQELRFTLTTVNQSEYVKTAELLQEYWKVLNIEVELNIVEPSRFEREILRQKNYEALLYGELIGFDPDPFPFWHSSQSLGDGLNLPSYFNKEVDTLLEDARKTNNAEERSTKYIEFQNLLMEDLPTIFLYNPSYTYASYEKVKGIETSRITVPADRFNGITEWYIKTRREWN